MRTAVHDARITAEAGAGVEANPPPHAASAEIAALVLCFAHRAIKGRQLAWSLLLEPVDRVIDVERLEYRKAYADLVADILDRGIRSGELTQQNSELSGAAIVGPLSPLHMSDTASSDEVIADITALCLRAAGSSKLATVLTGKASS